MREHARATVFQTVIEIGENAVAVFFSVQRTETKKTIKMFFVNAAVAREILAFGVLEKCAAILHSYKRSPPADT